MESIVYPGLLIGLRFVLNSTNLEYNSFLFVDVIFFNFSVIVHEKLLNIPDSLENGFESNLNFCILCLLLGGYPIFEILNFRLRVFSSVSLYCGTCNNHHDGHNINISNEFHKLIGRLVYH